MKHDSLIKWIEKIERRINGAFSSILSLQNSVTALQNEAFTCHMSTMPSYADAQTYVFVVTGKGFGNDIGAISVTTEDLNGNSFAAYFTINSISFLYPDMSLSLNVTVGNLPGGSTSSVHFKITIGGTKVIYSPVFQVTG